MIKILLLILLIGLITGFIINWSVFLIDKKILLVVLTLVLTSLIWWLTSFLESGLSIATWGLTAGIIFSLRTSDKDIKKLKKIMYYTMIITSLILWVCIYAEVVNIN